MKYNVSVLVHLMRIWQTISENLKSQDKYILIFIQVNELFLCLNISSDHKYIRFAIHQQEVR